MDAVLSPIFLVGIFYLIVGLFMVDEPLQAAAALTLLVAASLIIGGILRIVLSMSDRFDGWGWVLSLAESSRCC
jgi:uncharacterized membrane protein HdeD (DUF308 family)